MYEVMNLFSDCKNCGCDSFGRIGSSCDDNGHCNCKPNFMGIKCNQCAPERNHVNQKYQTLSNKTSIEGRGSLLNYGCRRN